MYRHWWFSLFSCYAILACSYDSPANVEKYLLPSCQRNTYMTAMVSKSACSLVQIYCRPFSCLPLWILDNYNCNCINLNFLNFIRRFGESPFIKNTFNSFKKFRLMELHPDCKCIYTCIYVWCAGFSWYMQSLHLKW